MRLPNQVIKRTRHIIQTINDMVVEQNGARVFLTLDLNQGYLRSELSKKPCNITTFTTHVRINSAADVFQNVLRIAFEKFEGVQNISNNVIVYTTTQKSKTWGLMLFCEDFSKRISHLIITVSSIKRNKNSLGMCLENSMSADPKTAVVIKNTPLP